MTSLSLTTPGRREGTLGERLGTFLVVLFVMAYKSNDALSLPQFWAEDATVFFTDQYGQGLPQIFAPYAGYLLAIPRLVAWIAAWLPVAKAPLIYNAAAILFSTMAITYTCRRLRGHIPAWIVALSMLAVPTNGEIFGTITNVQWFLQFAMAACCLLPAEASTSRITPWMRAVLIMLIALTGPFSTLLLAVMCAIAAAAWLAKRTRIDPFNGALSGFMANRDWPTVAAMTIGGIVQAVVILSYPEAQRLAGMGPAWVLDTTFTKLVPPHIFGVDFLTGTAWLLLYGMLIGTLLLARRIDGHARLTVLGFIAFAIVETFVPMLRMTTPSDLVPLNGDRYFYLVKVVWWWAVWLALSGQTRRGRANATAMTTALISLFALTNAQYLRRPPFKDFDWKGQSAQLKQPGPHTIPVNPYDWKIEVETAVPDEKK
ncbi:MULTISPECIES: hypothetical protein [Stenotrophomonas]|jgi:hypothetical protein|uniref:hypothetical protein n=1 Tax=Stenotrophomonas TaxID=40323 RepID=UPI0012B4AE09|nr:hypothetical protein [Stenotrophomonas indicatrix]QGL62236.1 hypothetical protein FEO87_02790 [Stenotrophomonas maltophilia]QXQ03091.1 hypothetical protein KX724_02905 [Stenotrophomonas indicatrix]